MAEFPETAKEFEGFASFRTHKPDTLVRLSGVTTRIKGKFMVEWSTVRIWDPEIRYKPVGTKNQVDVREMIDAARVLVREL